MTIETIPGNLLAYKELVPGTMQHWDELSPDQVKDNLLRGQAFYAADYPQYSMDGSHPVLDMARNTPAALNNLVLAHLFDTENSSYDQLVRGGGNFRPDPEEAKRVMEAAGTLRTPLREMRLQGANDVYRSLRVRTADGMILIGEDDAVEPNRYEGLLLDRAGVTSDFRAALQEEPYRIQETGVLVLSPDYVEMEAAKSPVGRAAWRGSFNGDGSSDAYDCFVDYRGALRGVCRVVVAVGDAPQKK